MTRKPASPTRLVLPDRSPGFLRNSQRPQRRFASVFPNGGSAAPRCSILLIIVGRWHTDNPVIRHRVIRPIQLSRVVLITGPAGDPLVVLSIHTWLVSGYPTKAGWFRERISTQRQLLSDDTLFLAWIFFRLKTTLIIWIYCVRIKTTNIKKWVQNWL